MPGDSTFLLRLDSETKLRWHALAQERGLTVTRLILDAMEGCGQVGVPVGGVAASCSEPSRLGSTGVGPEPSLPVVSLREADSAAKEESVTPQAPGGTLTPARRSPSEVKLAKRTPVEVPRPQRRHDPMCNCLMCRG